MINYKKIAPRCSRHTPESYAAYVARVAAENQALAAAQAERSRRAEMRVRAEHAMAVRSLADAMDRLQGSPTRASRPPAADRIGLVVVALIEEGRFDATQADVAALASCDERDLRRGGGKDWWRRYQYASSRSRQIDGVEAARSVQQCEQGQKLMADRRSDQ